MHGIVEQSCVNKYKDAKTSANLKTSIIIQTASEGKAWKYRRNTESSI
jgi:hypothetical protein